MNLEHLFPVPFVKAFTTCTTITHPQLAQVLLDAKRLGLSKGKGPETTVLKNDVQAWEAFYPKGSINPRGKIFGGFGCYLQGPPGEEWQERMKAAKDVMFSYSVCFENGFEWQKGGKLPGIYGGIGDAAYGCTGGRKDELEACRCFNLRLMWRTAGDGELYAYLPAISSNTSKLLSVPPLSKQNPDYGFSVGRGAFSFSQEDEVWHTVAERVKLNDISKENGSIEVYLDGQRVISVNGIVFRTDEISRINGLHFQTFFGGHTEEWASPRDQRAWFANISGAIIA